MEGVATTRQAVFMPRNAARFDKRGKGASGALAIALGIVRASAYGVLEA
jgi:hypothetical protein